MYNNNLDKLVIEEIREEYKKIDNDWLVFQYKISIGLFVFAIVVECIMSLLLTNSDMLTTSINRYILKFIIAPSLVNFFFIIGDTLIIRSKKLTQDQKIFGISINLVLLCFVLFTVHNAFIATYFLFVFAIILTTIYANIHLTGITALLSLVALIISELFIKWDADKPSVFYSIQRLSEFLISLCIIIAASAVCLVKISFIYKKNEASIQKEMERVVLEQRLKTDELTGVLNRKALHDAMRDLEMSESTTSYIFGIADIDNFKSVNDQLGHLVGDNCLFEFATMLEERSRGASVFRYGGDEFCLIFENVNMEEAVSTCENIQSELIEVYSKKYPTLDISVSFGLTHYLADGNSARLFINADQALYDAKELRNTIRIYE